VLERRLPRKLSSGAGIDAIRVSQWAWYGPRDNGRSARVVRRQRRALVQRRPLPAYFGAGLGDRVTLAPSRPAATLRGSTCQGFSDLDAGVARQHQLHGVERLWAHQLQLETIRGAAAHGAGGCTWCARHFVLGLAAPLHLHGLEVGHTRSRGDAPAKPHQSLAHGAVIAIDDDLAPAREKSQPDEAENTGADHRQPVSAVRVTGVAQPIQKHAPDDNEQRDLPGIEQRSARKDDAPTVLASGFRGERIQGGISLSAEHVGVLERRIVDRQLENEVAETLNTFRRWGQ